MTDLTSPLDHTHRDCRRLRAWVNDMFQEAKDRAALWVPRPSPWDDYEEEPRHWVDDMDNARWTSGTTGISSPA